jgi:hypothetical protein
VCKNSILLNSRARPRLLSLLDACRFWESSGTIWGVAVAKTLRRVLSGTSDASVRFDDLCSLLESLEFEKRVRGSHHLFRKAGVEEKINLQRDGNNAKPYQVRQVRAVLLKYGLGGKAE